MLLHIYFYTASHGTPSRHAGSRPPSDPEKKKDREPEDGRGRPSGAPKKSPSLPIAGRKGPHGTGGAFASRASGDGLSGGQTRPGNASARARSRAIRSAPYEDGKKGRTGPRKERSRTRLRAVPAEGRLVRPRERGFRDKRLSENRARQKSRPIRSGSRKTAEAGFRLPEDGPPAPAADRGGPCRWGRTGRKCRAP